MKLGIKGEGRVILRELDGTEVLDTGWISNTVTDNALTYLNLGFSMTGNNVRLFIHQGTHPGRVLNNILPNAYADQNPNQVRNADTTVFDQNVGISTFTVQFPVPTVARNINIVGLCNSATTVASGLEVFGVFAYTRLTSTVVQGTSQTADVQYRITWSFP